MLPGPAAELRASLLAWYDRHRRSLPWRAAAGERVDPWRVLVSELMLQQTTAAAVAARFNGFVERFPTPTAMATAALDEVLHAWQGLGYYRRARALHACATALVGRHGGEIPRDPESLRALPGVGPYTAAAVAAIAFDLPVVPVDGNVERVLARLVALERPLPIAKPVLVNLAGSLATPRRAGDLAQALMELGALVCSPARPGCLACPWRRWCAAAAAGTAERYPLKAPRSARPLRCGSAFLLRRGDGAVLFRRRVDDGLLGGMIELPSTPWDRAAAVANPLDWAPARTAWRELPGKVRHVFTHFALELELLCGDADGAVDGLWASPDEWHRLALPTLTRKLLAHAGYHPPRPDTLGSGRNMSAK